MLITGEFVGTLDDGDRVLRGITGAVFLLEPTTAAHTAGEVLWTNPDTHITRVVSDVVFSFDLFAGQDQNSLHPVVINNVIMLSDGATGFKNAFDRVFNLLEGRVPSLEENGQLQDVTAFLHAGAGVTVQVRSDVEPVPVPGAVFLFGSALPLFLRNRKKAAV